MSSSQTHHHAKAHQEDHQQLHRLSLPAQLNCECDDLAKAMIIKAIFDDQFGGINACQSLPL